MVYGIAFVFNRVAYYAFVLRCAKKQNVQYKRMIAVSAFLIMVLYKFLSFMHSCNNFTKKANVNEKNS